MLPPVRFSEGRRKISRNNKFAEAKLPTRHRETIVRKDRDRLNRKIDVFFYVIAGTRTLNYDPKIYIYISLKIEKL